MEIQRPKGTLDVVPGESYKWQYVENIIRSICDKYGFNEARTPVIEHTELFARGVGDTTDIVQKEMYTFDDRGGRSLTLKPEGTAGVVRMFIENRLFNDAQPTKMYYLNAPIFRYERPQSGRYREHHQFGIEVFGAPRASQDAECISIALELFKTIGIKELVLHINSIGCPDCRKKYNEALRAYLDEYKTELCPTCLTRLERNPLRILDCKEQKCKDICKDAPKILDSICDDCKAHFDELQASLDSLGIEYVVDPFIVRGLDYYTRTVFEIISTHIGSQGAVCAGGRYDRLVAQLGGSDTPAVGFGLGLERLLLVAKNQGIEFPAPKAYDIYIASLGEKERLLSLRLAAELRAYGLKADIDHVGRSIKAQFKYASKLNVRFTGVIGDKELENGMITVKNMALGTEETIPQSELHKYLAN